jgi:hypothetical protein
MTTRELLTECFHIENPLLHTQQHTKRLGSILWTHGWKPYPVRARDSDDPAGKAKQFKAFVKPIGPQEPPPPPLPVTGVHSTKKDIGNTGNGLSPNNDVAVTGVTGVTGSLYTQGEKAQNDEICISRKNSLFMRL